MNALMLTQSATNSTIIPRPSRQLHDTDPFHEFQISGTDMVKINQYRFRIIQFIKKGGFESVHEATEVVFGEKVGKKVAIKLITPKGTEEDKAMLIERAKKEIHFLKMFKKSANVVTILNSEVKGSSVAIVMEYCDKDTRVLDEKKELMASQFNK